MFGTPIDFGRRDFPSTFADTHNFPTATFGDTHTLRIAFLDLTYKNEFDPDA